jgi:hypothetical protein
VPAISSRDLRQNRLDAWLQKNCERLATEDANSIARALQAEGFFSQNTAPIDIRMSFRRRCLKLGLPCKPS